MDNPIFVSNKNKPLVTHHDEDCDDDNDYDDYNTPSTIRADDTIITMPGSMDKRETLTLRLRRNVKLKIKSWLHCICT